jgi:O-antigen ligase
VRTIAGDAAGAALALALAAWTVASALVNGSDLGDAAAVVGLIALAAGGFAAGRAIGGRAAWLVPAAIATAVLVATVSDWPASAGPEPGVLGYSNASAELAVQGFAAALAVVAVARRSAWSVPALVVAVVLAAATLLGDSVAAQVLLVLPAVALVAAATGIGARWFVAALAGLVLGALALTVVLGAIGGGSETPGRDTSPLIESTLSGRRTDLWHDALVLMSDHPAFGVGPGRFAEESPTARSDRDARWAHNGFLQMGAETGIPGLLLLAALFVWGFARLGLGGGPRGPALVAAAALAALGIHACVDYVLHFPALPLATAALVGAVAPRRNDEPGGTS